MVVVSTVRENQSKKKDSIQTGGLRALKSHTTFRGYQFKIKLGKKPSLHICRPP